MLSDFRKKSDRTKITVRLLDEKRAILRHKLRLREEKNPDYVRNLFITPDLTPSEQKESKAMRLKLTHMNKGAKKFRIKTDR